MLNALRSAAGTWVSKLLLIILVVSFGIWGITGRLVGGFTGSGSVVQAGDIKVSPTEFRLAFNRQVNVLSQQFGQQLTPEQAQAFGVEDQVLNQLVAGAVLDSQAKDLGLGVSDERIAQQTFADPAFQGAGGAFDRRHFDYVLQQVGMSQSAYFKNREQTAARQQIVDAVSDGVAPPDAFLRAVSLYRGEDRTVDFLVLPPSLVQPIEEPAADKLDAFFTERQKTYAAPEYRKLAVVKLEAADIADDAQIAEEDVRKSYDANKARYTTAETRTIEQISFPDKVAADAALAAIRGGKTFEQAVTDAGKTMPDVALGTLQKTQIPDAAVADAAFKLAPNAVSDVVQGSFGPVLLRVTAVMPEAVQPYDTVSAAIRHELALAEAGKALLSIRDSFEDARASGSTLREAADKAKLKVQTIDAIDRSGQRPDGTVINDLPASQDLIAAAFEAEQNTDNEPVALPGGGSVFYDVEGVTAARDRGLDEVRAKVIADWKADQTTQRLGARGAELQKQVKDGGKTLDALAADLKLEKQTKRGLKRDSNDGDFGEAGTQAAFGVAEGGVGLVPSQDNQILFKVVQVSEPIDAGPEAIDPTARKRYADGLSNDMLTQLVAVLQAQYTVRVDRDLASRAMSTTSR